MKHRIPFTQFLMPDGRQARVDIAVDDAEFAQWLLIRERGFRLTVELLSDWTTVSQCIEDRELGDYDNVLAPNGPQVPEELSKMLLRFDPIVADKFIKKRRKKKVPLEPYEVTEVTVPQLRPGVLDDDGIF